MQPVALAVLLWVAAGGDWVRDDGGRSQRPHRLLPAVPADPRRFRLGSGCDRRDILVRLSRLGPGNAVRRPADGSARPGPGGRARRCRDGGGAPPGVAGARGLAALPDAWRAGRRRYQLSRLYRAVAVPDQLVRAPPRPGAQHHLFRGRHRLDHTAALVADADRGRRLAHRLLDTRHSRPGPAGAAEFAAAPPSAGPLARSLWVSGQWPGWRPG